MSSQESQNEQTLQNIFPAHFMSLMKITLCPSNVIAINAMREHGMHHPSLPHSTMKQPVMMENAKVK
jgi:hypothetical protein